MSCERSGRWWTHDKCTLLLFFYFFILLWRIWQIGRWEWRFAVHIRVRGAYALPHTHARLHARTLTRTHLCTHLRTYARTRAARARTHTHTHTHTRARARARRGRERETERERRRRRRRKRKMKSHSVAFLNLKKKKKKKKNPPRFELGSWVTLSRLGWVCRVKPHQAPNWSMPHGTAEAPYFGWYWC